MGRQHLSASCRSNQHRGLLCCYLCLSVCSGRTGWRWWLFTQTPGCWRWRSTRGQGSTGSSGESFSCTSSAGRKGVSCTGHTINSVRALADVGVEQDNQQLLVFCSCLLFTLSVLGCQPLPHQYGVLYSRLELFNMINDLPTCYEVVSGKARSDAAPVRKGPGGGQPKRPRPTVSAWSGGSSMPGLTISPRPQMTVSPLALASKAGSAANPGESRY